MVVECREAEKLEQQAEETKNTSVFEDMDISDPVLRMSLMSMGPMDNRAIIIVNAQCEIQMTNHSAHEVLGYGKNEMVGRNINIIIPSPYSEHHTAHVRAYLKSSKCFNA